jgi:ArsR family transcriptional regulator, arsenate/arsenite/antimonite-responsive transcriptional repressor
MNMREAVRSLGALAQDSRLAVFRLLVQRGPEGFAAGELGERLDIPGPTLSFHLKALSQAGLVTTRRDGRFIFYAAGFERMNALVKYLTDNCCVLGSSSAAVCGPTPSATPRTRRSSGRRGRDAGSLARKPA